MRKNAFFFGIPVRSIVPFAQLSRTTDISATKASAFAKATADRLRHEEINYSPRRTRRKLTSNYEHRTEKLKY